MADHVLGLVLIGLDNATCHVLHTELNSTIDAICTYNATDLTTVRFGIDFFEDQLILPSAGFYPCENIEFRCQAEPREQGTTGYFLQQRWIPDQTYRPVAGVLPSHVQLCTTQGRHIFLPHKLLK